MAATRRAPDSGNAIVPYDGLSYETRLDDEISALWNRIVERPSGIAGTNDVTGTVAASDVTVMAAYGPVLIIRPVITNTGPVRINIDGIGLVSVLDSDGNALISGEFFAGRDHALVWDPAGSYRLVANGSAPPATIAQPGPVVLDVQTAPGGAGVSSLIVPASVLTSTYARYECHLDSIKLANDDIDLYLRIGNGAGPTFAATGYNYTLVTNATVTSGVAATQIVLTGRPVGAGAGVGNGAGKYLQGRLSFSNPTAATDFMPVKFDGTYVANNNAAETMGCSGYWTTVGAVTGLQFFASSGNIVSGTIRTMGWPKV